MCSCEDWRPGHVDIAFNVVDIPSSQCRLYSRRGLCTGWLDDITQPLQHDGKGGGDVATDLVIQMESVSLENIEVSVLQVWGMCECVGGWCVCVRLLLHIYVCLCVHICVCVEGGGGREKVTWCFTPCQPIMFFFLGGGGQNISHSQTVLYLHSSLGPIVVQCP